MLKIPTEEELSGIFSEYLKNEYEKINSQRDAATHGESPEASNLMPEMDISVITHLDQAATIAAFLKTISYNNRVLSALVEAMRKPR